MREKSFVGRIGALLLILCLSGNAMPLFSQDADTSDPVPYGEDEFPQWLEDLRRAEIIAVGSFPFSLFFANFGYDLLRFTVNGFSPEYVPWPFKGEGAPQLSNGEKTGILLAGVGISLTIALIDYILGRNEADDTDVPVTIERGEPIERIPAGENMEEQTIQGEDAEQE